MTSPKFACIEISSAIMMSNVAWNEISKFLKTIVYPHYQREVKREEKVYLHASHAAFPLQIPNHNLTDD